MSDDLVWVRAWQMQCCGEPFAAGDEVTWALDPAHPDDLRSLLGAAADEVRWVEEHHSERQQQITVRSGRVRHVDGVWCRSEPVRAGGSEHRFVPESALRDWVERADGWDHPREDAVLVGYLVSLRMHG